MPTDRNDDDLDFTFSGLAKDFPEFKKKVNKKSMANEWDIIMDMAQVVAAVLMILMQNKFEDDEEDETEQPKPAEGSEAPAEGEGAAEGAAAAAAALPATPPKRRKRKIGVVSINDVDETLWAPAMMQANGGSITGHIWIETTAHLQKTLGKSWRDNKELGIDDIKEYEAMKSLSINKLYRTKNRQFLLMLQQACIPTSRASIPREAEALRVILCTHEVEEMISGSTFPHGCVSKPWKMPAVKAWALMILKYEGVSDAVSGNFLRDFTDLLSSAQGKGRRSIYELDTAFEHLVNPFVRNFGTVKAFTEYLQACLRAEVIYKLAQSKAPEARAWQQANNLLLQLRTDNAVLSLDITRQAIALAEDHLTLLSLETSTSSALQTQAEEEEQKADDEVQQLKAML